jgi:DNA repair exonuclease SbcCD ATPase subunit
MVEPIKDYTEEIKTINDKLVIASNLEKEMNKLDYDYRFNNSMIHSIENEIEKINNKNEETNCSECFQPISKEHILSHVEKLKKQMSELQSQNEHILTKINSIKEALTLRDNLNNRLSEIDGIKNRYNKQVETSLIYANVVTKYKKDLELEKIKLESPRQDNPYLSKLEVVKNEANPFIKELKLTEELVNPLISDLDNIKNEVNQYTSLLLDIQPKLQALAIEVSKLDNERKKFLTGLEYAKWWKDALHIYIKSYLVDSFIEQINTIANERLTSMFDGILSLEISATSDVKKEVKEKISVTIFNKNEECSYNSLSGGERCRICFALNLAISSVINQNFGFIMFDEVLNGLDDVGKNQVMNVLKELETNYPTIFVIDHTTEFKSLFTNNILVNKKNGISSLVL